jgi:hypothetical protein
VTEQEREADARPELKSPAPDLADFDTVLIGMNNAEAEVGSWFDNLG